MPDPIASPVAAPSAPVSAPAPVATPSVAPAAPVSTPEAPVTPAVTPTDPSAPVTPSEPAITPTDAPPAPTSPEPKSSDYENSPEGQEQFLKDLHAWERGEEIEQKQEEPASEVKTKEKPAEEQKEDDGEPKLLDEPEAALTPEGLQAELDANPAFKAVLDADPKLNGKLFKVFREHAKLKPIGDLFPTVEAATFANESSAKFVGLRSSIMLADTPDKMGGAIQGFMDEFKIVDDKGNPVLDANGQPTYGEDLQLFQGTMIDGYIGGEIKSLEDRIAANKYANENLKDNDETALAALNFVRELRKQGDEMLDKPDISGLSPEAQEYFKQRDAELQAEREKLGLKSREQQKQERTAGRQQFESKVWGEFGKNAGSRIDKYLEQKRADGVYIPKWVTDLKDSKYTDMSQFAVKVYGELNKTITSIPQYRAKLAEMQMLPANDGTFKARTEYMTELIDRHLPEILDGEVRSIQRGEMEDVKARKEQRQQKRTDARVEPQTAGTPQGIKGLNDQQIYDLAKTNVAKKYEGKFLSDAERMAKTLEERNRLESGR